MKKLIAVTLAICTLFSLSIFAEAASTSDDRVVLFDKDGITLYLTGEYEFYDDEYSRMVFIETIIENESDTSIGVECNYCSINGWELYASGLSDTRAGKKQRGEITLYLDNSDVASEEDIKDCELEIVLWDANTYEDYCAPIQVSLWATRAIQDWTRHFAKEI